MRDLRNRVAVVTGAASGIGRATALALAREGCDVAVADIDGEGAGRTADEVRLLGRHASAWTVDVADKAAMRRFADDVVAEHGAVHVLVNNAGVSVAGTFEEQSLEDFEWIFGINFWGVVYGCKFFLPHIKRQSEGHIVNVSSVFGLAGFPTQSSYCATKFAVRGLSESLWVELRDSNIRVTSVHPGGVKTNIARSSRASSDDHRDINIAELDRIGVAPEEAAEQIVRAIKANKQRALVARGARAIEYAKRLAPALGQHLLLIGYRRQRGRLSSSE
ncbi:MAG: SDR family NAD(P)-dependent oxidoreductase [Myxococcales bacterium]|nr:SDR family NAD(P)-dependent oxidoreductase [Myxococcales bacterium]MDD9971335.1 SDR family NAD(P)-dependent oxidoreductase [Myxococcales bacterium]